MGEFGLLSPIRYNTMNNVHLEVEKLTIHRVLWRSMEMVLKTLEFGTIATLIKQADCWCVQEVVIQWMVLHDELILLTFFVELKLLLRINISVSEFENTVFKGFEDRNTGFEVDGCLLNAITNDAFFLLFNQIIVGSEPVILSKLTWSLVESICIVLAKIIIEVVLVLVRATWHTAYHWQLDPINIDTDRSIRRSLIEWVKIEKIKLFILASLGALRILRCRREVSWPVRLEF